MAHGAVQACLSLIPLCHPGLPCVFMPTLTSFHNLASASISPSASCSLAQNWAAAAAGARPLRCLPAGLHHPAGPADAMGCHQPGTHAADSSGEWHQHLHDLGLCGAEGAGRRGGGKCCSHASSRQGANDRDFR